MAKPPPPPVKAIPGYMNFLQGGTAGILAICCVQPADLVKTRMQLMGQEGRKASIGIVAGEIIKREGLRGFYNGISAAIFRQATYTTGRLGSFNWILDLYKKTYGTPNFGGKILMGMTAGGIGSFFGVPAEVCLIRMTADGRLPPEKRRNYKHVFDALLRIIREEGVLTLWRGGTATITRAMVVNGAQLATYAQASEVLAAYMREGIPKHFVASMTAGFVTAFASMPVDIVKTRVQNAEKGTSQFKVLGNIIKKEGVPALWSGFFPTWAKIGPHTVLTFIFLEQLKLLYYKYS